METLNVTAELIKVGILGPVLVAAGIYIVKLSRTLQKVQEERAADAKMVLEKLLALNDKWNTVLSAEIHAVEMQREALHEVKEALRDVREAIHRGFVNGK